MRRRPPLSPATGLVAALPPTAVSGDQHLMLSFFACPDFGIIVSSGCYCFVLPFVALAVALEAPSLGGVAPCSSGCEVGSGFFLLQAYVL